jgi:hypothetical protein
MYQENAVAVALLVLQKEELGCGSYACRPDWSKEEKWDERQN